MTSKITMKRRIIAIEEAPKAIGPYSQGIAVSGQTETFYFSGALGIDPKTGKIEGDVTAQTVQTFKNIDALLKANGLTADNVIKTLVFITDMRDFPLVNAEYSKYFPANPPARSCVAVRQLPLNGLVEIEVIAMK